MKVDVSALNVLRLNTKVSYLIPSYTVGLIVQRKRNEVMLHAMRDDAFVL